MTAITIETPLGVILVDLFAGEAPITVANFLRYVDEGLYAGAAFYRALRPNNGKLTSSLSVIQGGVDPTCAHAPLAPIAHETTAVTGLRHLDGTLSMARWAPGTAASEFFIVIGDAPELDSGGAYEEGYAVFGRVVEGMNVVRAINAMSTDRPTAIDYMVDQALEPVPLRVMRSVGQYTGNKPSEVCTDTESTFE